MYDKFIVSALPGAAGHFVKSIIDRIYLNSEDVIKLDNFNSAHNGVDKNFPLANIFKNYTGVSHPTTNIENIYDIFNFDPPNGDFEFSSILHSHVYPNFETINKRFQNIGIILITISPEDINELIFNASYKNFLNRKILATTELKIREKRAKNLSVFSKFYNEENRVFPINCCVIKYIDIFTLEGNDYKFLKILKDFLGVSNIPNSVKVAAETYLTQRNLIVKQYKLR